MVWSGLVCNFFVKYHYEKFITECSVDCGVLNNKIQFRVIHIWELLNLSLLCIVSAGFFFHLLVSFASSKFKLSVKFT